MQRTLLFALIFACATPLAASEKSKAVKAAATESKAPAAAADSKDKKPQPKAIDSKSAEATPKADASESKHASKSTKSTENKAAISKSAEDASRADASPSKHASKKSTKRKHSAANDTLVEIHHERVDYWVAAFSKMHDYHKKIAAGFERKAKYQGMLEKKLRQHGMPQSLIYLAFEESAFDPDAGSRQKAVGVWQLTPATARLYGLKVNKKVDQRKNVEMETDAALRFLSHLHKRFGCWYLAAAAYNSGENRIARLMRKRFGREKGTDRDYYRLWDDIPGETRDYVPAIIALKQIGKDPAKYGF